MKLNPDGSSSRSLDDRAADALVRIKVGYAPMQIPPDDADADLVITAMRARLAAQEIELTRRAQSEQNLRERVDEYKREVERRDEMISGDAHMLAEARATAELHQAALAVAEARENEAYDWLVAGINPAMKANPEALSHMIDSMRGQPLLVHLKVAANTIKHQREELEKAKAKTPRCDGYALAGLPGVTFCRKDGARIVSERLQDVRRAAFASCALEIRASIANLDEDGLCDVDKDFAVAAAETFEAWADGDGAPNDERNSALAPRAPETAPVITTEVRQRQEIVGSPLTTGPSNETGAVPSGQVRSQGPQSSCVEHTASGPKVPASAASLCTLKCWAMPNCARCGLRKAPRGRSVPLAAAGGYCDSFCQGYNEEPKPGHLWPEEEPERKEAVRALEQGA